MNKPTNRKTILNALGALSLIVALGVVTGCGEPKRVDNGLIVPSESGSLQIVATTSMIADIVRNVTGDTTAVSHLMGSGVDPHLYKPTRADVVALQQADIIFYNGLHLEGKMGDVLGQMEKSGKTVVAVAERLGDYPLIEGDPHVWMDVAAWIKAQKVVVQVYNEWNESKKDGKIIGIENTDIAKELKSLEQYARESIEKIPENLRVLITAHDAFSYFGRAYGLEVKGIQGISTESETGVKDLEDLIDFIVERKVPAVFVESSVSQKNVKALVEGCKARGHTLTIGGELFSDAMGTEGSYEGTYIGMIDHNVTTITRALGGSVPERGLNGKLRNHQDSEN